MRREDWLWLLIKAAGLWLVVTAVEVMSAQTWSWFKYGETDAAGREQLLRVTVPLASGLGLLFVDFARWLPVAPPEPVQATERPSSMSRSDWLWIGLKVVGACYALWMVVFLGQFVFLTSGGASEWGLAVVGPAAALALSLWLLIGDRVWRVATRESGAQEQDVAAGNRPRRTGHARDVAFVVVVFAVLGATPILLLWWAGGD